MEPIKTYLTVRQMASKYPCFSEPAYRALIVNRHKNGLTPLIKKVGTKILIDEAGFADWIDSQGEV